MQNRPTLNNNNGISKSSKIETCPLYPYNTTNITHNNYESKSQPLSSTSLHTKDISCDMKAIIIGTAEKKIKAKLDRRFAAHSRTYTFDATANLRNFINKEATTTGSTEEKLEKCYNEVFSLNSTAQMEPDKDRKSL
jgi:hypothetical protein